MATFGRAGGGGRRIDLRRRASLMATLTTLSRIASVTLTDVSTTGARLKLSTLPQVGEEACLSVGQFQFFGAIRWAEGAHCGIAFSEPLTRFQMTSLLSEFDRGGRVAAEVRAAREEWLVGRVR
jgi:hypothetical protein